MGWDRLRFLHLLEWLGSIWGSEVPERSLIDAFGVEGIGGEERAGRLGYTPWVCVSHIGCPWCSEAMVNVLRKTSSRTAQ